MILFTPVDNIILESSIHMPHGIKIDTTNEQVKQLKEIVHSKDQTIKRCKKTIKNQEEVIKLLKEKEEFLSAKKSK